MHILFIKFLTYYPDLICKQAKTVTKSRHPFKATVIIKKNNQLNLTQLLLTSDNFALIYSLKKIPLHHLEVKHWAY